VKTCGTSFQLFGGRSQTKKTLKAGPTLFLAIDKDIEIFLGILRVTAIFSSKVKIFLPPRNKFREKSRKNCTCNRHLNFA